MTQQGFLGTIGYIKANLMTSSQASEKGYSNDNFHPGADNIPDSEKFYTRRKIQIGTMQSYHISSGICKLYNNFSWGYARVENFPELKTCSEFKIHLKAMYSGGALSFVQPSSSYNYSPKPLARIQSPGPLVTLRSTSSNSPSFNWLNNPDTFNTDLWTDFEYSYNRKNNLNTIEIWNGDIHKKYTTTYNTWCDTEYFYIGPFSQNGGATGKTIRFEVDNCWFEFKE